MSKPEPKDTNSEQEDTLRQVNDLMLEVCEMMGTVEGIEPDRISELIWTRDEGIEIAWYTEEDTYRLAGEEDND